MIDLRQAELREWMLNNFGEHEDDIMRCALGMAEEVGEVCHHILKGTQKIRGGINGVNVDEVVDGVADTLVFGLQILSILGVDAEKEIGSVTENVLRRDWKKNPGGDGYSTSVVQGKEKNHDSQLPEKYVTLYHAANILIMEIGATGEIYAQHEHVEAMMHALHDIDGGVYDPRRNDNDT
jgi:NTP pyrophosphatase (non-canonical NTP hydrolase)